MIWRTLLFLLVFGGVMGGVHYYLWAKLVRAANWPAPYRRLATVVMVALGLSLLGGMLTFRSGRAIAAPFSWVGFTWLGVLFFLLVPTLGLELLRGGFSLVQRFRGADKMDPERRQFFARSIALGAGAFGLGTSAVALQSGLSSVAVKKVQVAIAGLPASAQGYRIVQLTDVHIGPTLGRGFLEEVIANVNALSPDIVVITGDLVDGSVSELTPHVAPLGTIKAKHGVFFVTGNHEYYSGADVWIAHLRTLGIRVLRNEHVQLPSGIDLAGIDDPSGRQVPGHGSDLAKAMQGRDTSRPVVLLAHQPKSIFDAVKHGVALQLSGHTHGGQMFPFNFFVRLQQPFVAGLSRLESAQIYVSCGTGYWGPPMRLRAPAEISEIVLGAA